MEDNRQENKIVSNPWLKQLFVSILGTAIGVGLTFTADRMVDKHKQEKSQRETALMVVYDIDEISRQINRERQIEDSLYEVAIYLSTHLEEIDSVSIDTLQAVLTYLLEDPTVVREWTVDTKEKAFNSNMETRRNLGSNLFYDNVQTCYNIRQNLITKINNSHLFQRPISHDCFVEFIQQLDYFNGSLKEEAIIKLLKQVIPQQSTRLYFNLYRTRKKYYIKTVNELRRLNRENKYLMGITNHDMDEFIKHNVEKSQSATNKLIEGTWTTDEADESEQETYTYRGDNTCEYVCHFTISTPSWENGTEVPVKYKSVVRFDGQWELKDDSLIMEYDTNSAKILSFNADYGKLPKEIYEHMSSDSTTIENWKEVCLGTVKYGMIFGGKTHYVTTLKDKKKVKIDLSGNTMIWTQQDTTAKGQIKLLPICKRN